MYHSWIGDIFKEEQEGQEPSKPESPAFDKDALNFLAHMASRGNFPRQEGSGSSAARPPASMPASFSQWRPGLVAAPAAANRGDNSIPAGFLKGRSAAPVTTMDESALPLAFVQKRRREAAAAAAAAAASGADAEPKQDQTGEVVSSSSVASTSNANTAASDPVVAPPGLAASVTGNEASAVPEAKRGTLSSLLAGNDIAVQSAATEALASHAGGRAPYDPEEPSTSGDVANQVQDMVFASLEVARKAAKATKAFRPPPMPLPPSLQPQSEAFAERDALDAKSDEAVGAAAAAADFKRRSNDDAPLLGELKAPSATSEQVDAVLRVKTRAQRGRSRSRRRGSPGVQRRTTSPAATRRPSPAARRRNRARSSSSSSRRNPKRSSIFAKTAKVPAEAKADHLPAQQAQAPVLSESELPEWLRDLAPSAEPPAPPPGQRNKRYISMPDALLGVLTDRNGALLRASMEKCASTCEMKVESVPQQPTGIISVIGDVKLGEQVLRDALLSKGYTLPVQTSPILNVAIKDTFANMRNEDIQIPCDLVRHFVGQRGANLQILEAKSGYAASIQVLPAMLRHGFQRIQITGVGWQKARMLVLQRIEELKALRPTLS